MAIGSTKIKSDKVNKQSKPTENLNNKKRGKPVDIY